mgnify:CR=1 FL=1
MKHYVNLDDGLLRPVWRGCGIGCGGARSVGAQDALEVAQEFLRGFLAPMQMNAEDRDQRGDHDPHPGLPSPLPPTGLVGVGDGLGQFVRALHPFRTLRKAAQSEEAILSLCEGSLVISIAGIEMSVKADGMWEGQARVSGRVLTAVAKVPLSDDPVHIVLEGSTIRIGPLGYPVVWQGWARTVIRLPMNASLDLVLAVGQRYSSEEIERAGLSKRVEDSLRKRDELIARAVEVLKPLRIERKDVMAWLEEYLRTHVDLDAMHLEE